MSRTLTAPLLAALGVDVTAPGFLVELAFSSPVRFSTRGSVQWNGNPWPARGATISGLAYDIGSPQQGGTLRINDPDLAMSALVLLEGMVGRSVNVWKFYGEALADGDPVQIFAGAGDAVTISPSDRSIQVSLVQRGPTQLYAPRRFMTRANGFSILPVAGRIVAFNGVDFTLERNRG